MRIAIVGAGAVGLGIGSGLLAAGHTVRFATPLTTRRLSIHLLETAGNAPAAIFGLRCYAA